MKGRTLTQVSHRGVANGAWQCKMKLLPTDLLTKQVVVRVNDENMAAVQNVAVEVAFPKCANAYLDKRHLWISYRREKMVIYMQGLWIK